MLQSQLELNDVVIIQLCVFVSYNALMIYMSVMFNVINVCFHGIDLLCSYSYKFLITTCGLLYYIITLNPHWSTRFH